MSAPVFALSKGATAGSRPALCVAHIFICVRTLNFTHINHMLLTRIPLFLACPRDLDPEQHVLGLEQHPLLVVVESAASALWGAVAAEVSCGGK